MSINANKLLRNPNCKGVNKKLKIRFSQKGNAVFQLILPEDTRTRTQRFAAKIIGYKIPQICPNAISAGAHDGFFYRLVPIHCLAFVLIFSQYL